MNNKFDDPKWTAYVLGELDDNERVEIEKIIADDPEAAAFVEELKMTTALISGEFSKEFDENEMPALTDQNLEKIEGELEEQTVSIWNKISNMFKTPRLVGGFATVTVGIIALMVFVNTPEIKNAMISQEKPVSEKKTSKYESFKIHDGSEITRKTVQKSAEEVKSVVGKPEREKPAKAYAPKRKKPPMMAAQDTSRRERRAGRNTRRKSKPKKAKGGKNYGIAMEEYGIKYSGTPLVKNRMVRVQAENEMMADSYLPAPEQGEGRGGSNTEAYDRIYENPFLSATQNPLSTFSIDVDTASYSNMRRFLNQGTMPPADSVRVEEFLNYFTYDYDKPKGDDPFSVGLELSKAPWQQKHYLVRIALKGKEIDLTKRVATNLVFLLDVSGSMNSPNKLPLVKSAMKILVDNLGENDRVAIAVYAGAAGLVLPSTSGDRKHEILEAIDRLNAGGSTNGGAGIKLAYDTAVKNFIKGGNNRVIIATDGDLNVGITSNGELIRLIEEKAKSGVFLTVQGYGMGNYKDSTLEKLADKGNGNYAYIDSIREAKKVMVEQMGGTLYTIAKDVKIQVEFNPAHVDSYRLIGYENRMLRKEDFHDDTKDAGEIGAGIAVTALYELIPKGVESSAKAVDALRYQQNQSGAAGVKTAEIMTLKLRYKKPDEQKSKLLEFPIPNRILSAEKTSSDFRFASAVAEFGMLLRDSKHKGSSTFNSVVELARSAMGDDKGGYRAEFMDLVKKARSISGTKKRH